MTTRVLRSSWVAGVAALLGLTALAGPAFASADDGGTKAFFDIPSPGSAYAAPAPESRAAPVAGNPNARASAPASSYEPYGMHRHVIHHHGWRGY